VSNARVCLAAVVALTALVTPMAVWAAEGQETPAVSVKTRETVEKFIKSVRELQPVDDAPLLTLPAGEAVICLGGYVNVGEKGVQWHAARAIWIVIMKQNDLAVRRQGLAIILPVSFKDETAARWMRETPADQFPAEAKDLVTKALADPSVTYGTILLAGWLEVEAARGRLRELAKHRFDGTDEGGDLDTPWAAVLALARMGDAQALQHLVKRVRNEKNDMKRATTLVTDLAYVGRPEAVRLLVETVLSNKRLPPLGPWAVGEPFGMRALGPLARVVEGFPLEAKDDYQYSIDDLARARTWLQKQQTLKLKGAKEPLDLRK
jgi:hypothetical protein